MRLSRQFSIVGVSLALAVGALIAQAPQGTPPPQTQGPGGGRGQAGGRGSEGTRIEEGQECPPGMTEFRHLRCMEPAQPPPTIVDYRPRSTVVAQEQLVPRAKF